MCLPNNSIIASLEISDVHGLNVFVIAGFKNWFIYALDSFIIFRLWYNSEFFQRCDYRILSMIVRLAWLLLLNDSQIFSVWMDFRAPKEHKLTLETAFRNYLAGRGRRIENLMALPLFGLRSCIHCGRLYQILFFFRLFVWIIALHHHVTVHWADWTSWCHAFHVTLDMFVFLRLRCLPWVRHISRTVHILTKTSMRGRAGLAHVNLRKSS